MKPGQHIKTVTTKSGKEIQLRHPKMEDVTDFLEYINTLSAENTFISKSGELETLEGETKWLQGMLDLMSEQDAVHIAAYNGDELVGTAHIKRDLVGKTRTRHIGELGLSVKKEYRADGVGYQLLTNVMDIAVRELKLTIIILYLFAINEKAYNLYKKIGFVEYGRLPKGMYYKGKYVDTIYMQRTV